MEFKGKTIDEAKNLGLLYYGIKEEDANVVVVKEAVKGLFGRIKEEAIVDVSKKEEKKATKVEKTVVKEEKIEKVEKQEEKKIAKKNNSKVDIDGAKEFVKKLLELIGVNGTEIKLLESEGNPVIELVNEKSSDIIGYRGEVLDAIQVLAGAVANVGNSEYKKVVVDCENYRSKREETLKNLANRLATKATEIRREVVLEPMNAFERRIIHSALAENTNVTTRSDGNEPDRHVVIVPNDLEEGSRPYTITRGGKNNGHNNGKFAGHKNFNHGSNRNRNNGMKKSSSSSFSFGTYLGNSKDN